MKVFIIKGPVVSGLFFNLCLIFFYSIYLGFCTFSSIGFTALLKLYFIYTTAVLDLINLVMRVLF